MARFELDKRYYFEFAKTNEAFNASDLTNAQLARTTRVSIDVLKALKGHFLQDHTSINFNELVETAFNNFYLFESEELIRELSKFEDVYCYHDDDVNSFDTFYVKSKLIESATGAYTYPESICVPTNIKGSSAFYLSHELCHMLKERNSKECEIRNAYSEVIPMLMEFIFSYTYDYDSFKVMLCNRSKKMKVIAREFVELYKAYIGATTIKDKKLYISALNKIGTYLHSFYYVLLLLKIYISDKEYFKKDCLNNRDVILDKVSQVLMCKCTTKDMLDSILSYIDNIDATYEDGMDLYNNFVFSI